MPNNEKGAHAVAVAVFGKGLGRAWFFGPRHLGGDAGELEALTDEIVMAHRRLWLANPGEVEHLPDSTLTFAVLAAHGYDSEIDAAGHSRPEEILDRLVSPRLERLHREWGAPLRDGCCSDRSCAPDTCMVLPWPLCCADCRRYTRLCRLTIDGIEPEDRVCDFFPRRFRAVEAES
jgi:hypothetical protein